MRMTDRLQRHARIVRSCRLYYHGIYYPNWAKQLPADLCATREFDDVKTGIR